MIRNYRTKSWLKTVLAMLAGALLMLVIQSLGERWSRQAEAATLDQLARSTMASLIQAVPWVGSAKIRGVAGLGDGRTFVIYTDTQVQFYQIGYSGVPPAASLPR